MGRKSKLSDVQWAAVAQRLLEGEAARELGREFGVSVAAIRGRFPVRKRSAGVQNDIAAHASAPVAVQGASQATGRRLAATLLVVTDHLSGAALAGAEMARRLAQMAQVQVARLDVIGPLAHGAREVGGADAQDVHDAPDVENTSQKMVDAIKRIQLLMAASNNAAELGMNLLKANKELTHADGQPTPVRIAFTVKDARRDADDKLFAEPAAGAVSATAA